MGRGYGQFCINGLGQIGAHVASYLLNVGGIPEGLSVCHTCDNPPCVRPSHLFLGTRSDNMRDMWSKGRNAPLRRRNCGKLRVAQVIDIREMFKAVAKGDKMDFYTAIAAECGVGPHAIRQVVHRRTWKDAA